MIFVASILFSCVEHGRSTKNDTTVVTKDTDDTTTKTNNISKKRFDTLKYYWQPDYSTYSFDTIVKKVTYQIKTYCLNDSAVYNRTFTDESSKNKNLIEYSVAHNYATDFIIKTTDNKKIKVTIKKINFKDHLPADFYKICHMWKNEFSHMDGKQLVLRATLAQPDTDYQYAVLYSITDKGAFKIIKVEDESYNGSDDE